MTSNFVTEIVRRSNRNLLLWSFVGALIVAGAGVLSFNYYRNLFQGPFPIAKKSIITLNDLNSLSDYYVTVEGDDALDTGYQYVSTSSGGSETVDYSYIALVLNDSLLLVKSPGIALVDPKTVYTGALVPIPADTQQEVVRDIEAEYPDLKGVFLPFMLDAGDFSTTGYIGLVIGAIVLLICLYGIFLSARRSNDPSAHPIMRGLKRFGDPGAMANQIHAEMQGHVDKVGKLSFTNNWLVNATGSSLNVTRLSDVAWFYKKVTQRRVNSVPVGKTYEALVWDRHGNYFTVQANENDVNLMLDAIGNSAPWAIGGYSDDLKTSWDKKRADFIAAVDAHRQSLLSANRQ